MLCFLCLAVFFIGGEAVPVFFPYGPYSNFHAPLYPGQIVPQQYSAGGLQSTGLANYYDGGKVLGNYYDNDALRNTVLDTQQSAIQGAAGSTGNHRVLVNTAGDQGYQHGSAGNVAQADGNVYAGGAQGYDLTANDGYGSLGGAGFNKGHKTTGFHKSYHNVEEGKNSKFIDEDNKYGAENFGKNYADLYGDRGFHGYGTSQAGEGYQTGAGGNSGARSDLRSVGIHDTHYGQHGTNGLYNGQDLVARSGQAGNFQNSGLAAGGRLHGLNSNIGAYSRPILYK